VQLTVDGLDAGSGMWEMALDRFREAESATRTGGKLVSLVETIREAGIDVSGHDALKTAPKGYPKDHPRIELLRYKGIIAWREWPAGAWLGIARRRIGWWRSSELRSRSTSGFEPTSGPRPCQSGGDRLG
jgi:hypothetical protein